MADVLKVLPTRCPGVPPCVGRVTATLLRLFSPHTSLSQDTGSICGSAPKKGTLRNRGEQSCLKDTGMLNVN